MRSCQFCGAPVAYVEPSVAQMEPAATPREEAARDQLADSRLLSLALPLTQKDDSAKIEVKKKRRPFIVAPVAGTLIVVGFIVFIGVGLRFFSQTFGNGNQSSINTPQSPSAAASSGDVNTAELGVDIYPGARELSAADRSNSADSSMVSATFISDDPTEKVIEFYKARMVGYTSIFASGDGVVVSISPSAQESVLVGISPAQAGGKTKISITNTTTKSAP
ncbi:MAG TPA: hypothetical protein VHX20_16345 [Terracidiphilus sp.]|nr:hypothetical protein [Terracidiphilus sp.]